jgi:hypothetical protein
MARVRPKHVAARTTMYIVNDILKYLTNTRPSPARGAPHKDEFGSLGPLPSQTRTCMGTFTFEISPSGRVWIEPHSGHYHFLPSPLQFISHHTTRSHIVQILAMWLNYKH